MKYIPVADSKRNWWMSPHVDLLSFGFDLARFRYTKNMKVVALISGGKDSCYNMMQCVLHGHEIVALANLKPDQKDELDSYMFQTVGHHAIDLYAEAIGLPLYRRTISGSSIELGKVYTKNDKDEVEDLYELLKSIKSEVEFDAISVGAILSDYQRVRVEHVCFRLGISSLAYLWRRDQKELYEEMVANGLVAIIIKVAVMGLSPRKHLGMKMDQLFPVLCKLNSQIGVNICGEGGEYETFTLDCPLFKKKIVIDDSDVIIHSDDAFAEVGFLHFKAVHLEEKPENQNKSHYDLVKDLPVQYRGDTVENVLPDGNINIITHVTEEKEISISIPDQEELEQGQGESLLYSESGRYVWISGLVGHKQDGITVEHITKTTMERLKDKVSSLAASFSDTVLMHLFVKNMADFGKVNSVYKDYFPLNPPARACVELDLRDNVLLQIDCLLYRAGSPGGDGQSFDDQTDKDPSLPRPVREAMHVQSVSHWASANIGPYSQAIKVDPLMFISGNIGLWPGTMTIIEGGISYQSALSLRHVDRIISAFSSRDSLLNVMQGFCYVTRREDIETARQAWRMSWRMALNLKSVDSPANKADTPMGLMSYVVVPTLPKGALVEWQATTNRTPEHWKRHQSSVKCAGVALEVQEVWCSDETVQFGAFTCIVVPTQDMKTVYLQVILNWFILELQKISSRHNLSLRELLTLRIFYVKSAIKTMGNELWECLRNTFEMKLPSVTAFTLLPVEGLEKEAVMMFSCWFQS